MMAMICCGVPIIVRMFQRDLWSRESNAGFKSICAAKRDPLYSILCSATRRREMMRSSVERQGVKLLCCGRCFRSRSVLMRDRQMCTNTLAGTDSREIPRYLEQSDFEHLPFQIGRMMANVQSAGIKQRSQTIVNIVRSQVTKAFPPYLRVSALIPQMPGARLFFSFLIGVSISSVVGCPVSMVALGTALAACVCGRISGVGCITKLLHEVLIRSV